MGELKRTLEIASVLLLYPTTWNQQIEEIEEAVHSITHEQTKNHLAAFLENFQKADLDQFVASYVQTIDFGKQTNLYLTYAQHGEQRERGTVLLELKQLYNMNGFDVVEEEMPDYLPLVLEFCAHAPIDAVRWVSEHYHKEMIEKRKEFESIESPYYLVIAAVLSIFEAYGLNPVVQEGEK